MSARKTNDAGFSLIEVMFAMLVLMSGVLALAGGIALGARRLTGTPNARPKRPSPYSRPATTGRSPGIRSAT
jgi:hypothetical protein